MLDLGLVCDNYSVELHGSSGCFLSLSIEQVKEAFVDSLDVPIGAPRPVRAPVLVQDSFTSRLPTLLPLACCRRNGSPSKHAIII